MRICSARVPIQWQVRRCGRIAFTADGLLTRPSQVTPVFNADEEVEQFMALLHEVEVGGAF